MRLSKLRIYEGAFALLGAAAFLLLAAAGKWRTGAGIETALGAALYLAWLSWLCARERPVDERLRVMANYLFSLWFYGATSRISQELGSPPRDASLLALDRILFGETPAVAMSRAPSSGLVEAMSACYLSYLVYLHVALIWVIRQSDRAMRQWERSLFTGFALGFAGYLLIPALGPGAAYPDLFSAALAGGPLARFNHFVVGSGASPLGTFPSLHMMNTLLLLEYDWRACRRRFWIMLVPGLGLLASTLYLRYHYAVDLLAGLILFLCIRGAHFIADGRGQPR